MRNNKAILFPQSLRHALAATAAMLCLCGANAQLIYKNPVIVNGADVDITDQLVAGDTIQRVGCTVKNGGLGTTANAEVLLDGTPVAGISGWVDDFGEATMYDNTYAPVNATAGPHSLALRVGFTVVTTRYFTVASVLTVSFDPTGGSPTPPDITVTNGHPYGTLPQPARAGHAFAGWYTNNTWLGDEILHNTIVMLDADHTLYAKWISLAPLTVTFHAQGGSLPLPASITVSNTFAYGALATTSRPGYTFDGWYLDAGYNGSEITASSTVNTNASHDLYAKWLVNPIVTATFDAGGGSAPVPPAITVTNGLPYGPLAVTARAGYSFDGWYASSNYSGTAITPATTVSASTNHTLYAKWEAQSYTVTLDPQGGSVSPTNISATFDAPYGALPGPARPGYTFLSWHTNAALLGDAITAASTVTIAANHTLYAKWAPLVTMTVTFAAQGGTAPLPPQQTVTNSFPYGSLAVTTRNGYLFNGWYTNDIYSGSAISGGTIVTEITNHTLYAKWSAQSYTVTLDPQGGNVSPTNISATFDAPYGAIPTPLRTGYTFVSWHTNAAFLGDAITATSTVAIAADHTLYAKWSAHSYVVTLNPQGGSVTPTNLTVIFGAPYGAIPTPTRTGYDFISWHTNAAFLGNAITAASTVAIAANHTLYAKWDITVVTVTFDAQGGAVTPASAHIAYGSTYGALPEPARHGYPPFEGWWTAPGGGGTKIVPSTIMTQTVDHAIYAKWYGEQFANFIIIDVAAGPGATNYPVSYLVNEPVGGWDANPSYSTTRIALKRVRSGAFFMGSPAGELGRDADETRHNVTISRDYFIGVFPITQRQWQLVMGDNPSSFTNGATAPQRPVEGISHDAARGGNWPADDTVAAASFIGRLRARSGIGSLDLPTEAQWEYACRAGTHTALNSGTNLVALAKDPNLDILGRYLLSGSGTNTTTVKVGAYTANNWGLYDFHGNVWEWCRDWYAPYGGDATDPAGTASGQNRIIRGGSWGSLAKLCRAADRNSATPETASDMLGLRLAAALPERRLAVESGSGSGWYAAGSVQRITAAPPPPGSNFLHWTVSPPGTNLGASFDGAQAETTLTIPAVDVTLSALYAAVATLTVTFDATGGTPAFTTKVVSAGAPYGALPVPLRTGYLFGGWWLSPAFNGTAITAATIVATTTNHTLFAKWQENGGGNNNSGDRLCPPLAGAPLTAKGIYDGFFYVTEPFGTNEATALRGTLAVKITTTGGKLTAKALLQSAPVSFSARAWDEITLEGAAHVTMSARGGETLDLYVMQNRIWGSIAGGRAGAAAMSLDGGRNRFADRTDAAAATLLNQFRGNYALALPVHEAIPADITVNGAPEGAGCAAISVGARGAARMAGVLADGTKVSAASHLIPYEECGQMAAVPLFVPLYARKGMAGGLLWLAPQGAATGDSDNGWRIRWEKPGRGADGFSALLDVRGGYNNPAVTLAATGYLLTADTAAAALHHAAGIALPQAGLAELPALVSGQRLVVPRGRKPWRVTVDDAVHYEFDPVNPTLATLSFAARTGIFKGSFTLYYVYELGGRVVLKGVKAPYTGIIIPTYSTPPAVTPQGLGHALAPESDPALSPLRLKRSYAVILDTP